MFLMSATLRELGEGLDSTKAMPVLTEVMMEYVSAVQVAEHLSPSVMPMKPEISAFSLLDSWWLQPAPRHGLSQIQLLDQLNSNEMAFKSCRARIQIRSDSNTTKTNIITSNNFQVPTLCKTKVIRAKEGTSQKKMVIRVTSSTQVTETHLKLLQVSFSDTTSVSIYKQCNNPSTKTYIISLCYNLATSVLNIKKIETLRST